MSRRKSIALAMTRTMISLLLRRRMISYDLKEESALDERRAPPCNLVAVAVDVRPCLRGETENAGDPCGSSDIPCRHLTCVFSFHLIARAILLHMFPPHTCVLLVRTPGGSTPQLEEEEELVQTPDNMEFQLLFLDEEFKLLLDNVEFSINSSSETRSSSASLTIG